MLAQLLECDPRKTGTPKVKGHWHPPFVRHTVFRLANAVWRLFDKPLVIEAHQHVYAYNTSIRIFLDRAELF
jgi:hypothetical protein